VTSSSCSGSATFSCSLPSCRRDDSNANAAISIWVIAPNQNTCWSRWWRRASCSSMPLCSVAALSR